MIRFKFELATDWPPNAWLAVCESGSVEVVVRHGPRVELADGWFCEATWPGAFEDGDFDRTDIVAGSGGRIRGGKAIFVGSGSTVDRLQIARDGKRVHVSNSLVCLIAALGHELDPFYRNYYRDFRSIVSGLSVFERRVRTLRGDLELRYFDNLVWDGTSLERVEKPLPARDLSSFESYRGFMISTMKDLVANAGDGARRFPYGTIGTLSSGYDSPTVAVIAKAAGNEEVLTFGMARGGLEDSGARIAGHLGLRCITIDRDAWRSRAYPEIPFLAADAYGEEMHFRGAEEHLPGRVLFTGYHGGGVWAKQIVAPSPEMVRADPSGLALTEYRLWTGFLHCPVPFCAARELRRIHAISNAEAMKPWDLGGSYNRPICRRIVEEAGVPRELFGRDKRAAAVVLWDRREAFLTDPSLDDYRDWLGRLSGQFLRSGQVPPLLADRLDALRLVLKRPIDRLPEGIAQRIGRLPGAWRLTANRFPPLFHYLFPWAVDHAVRRYGEAHLDRG
jgi:hypothetical protein